VRTIAAKAVATATIMAVFTILFQVLLAAALLPAAVVQGTTTGADADLVRSLIGIVLRGSALAAMASLIGFSVATVGRNTAVALGGAFVYLAILEGNLLGGIVPGIRRWLIVGNSIVFVSGHPVLDVTGRSVAGAGILLAFYAAGTVAVAAALFRARDVT